MRGIYAITNLHDGKVYVGSSENISRRWTQHRDLLRKGRHKNAHLQAAWHKYGEDSFAFSSLACLSADCALHDEENKWIESLKSLDPDFGYNRTDARASRLGIKSSEETCRKIGIAKRGNKNRLGKKHTAETKEKIRAARARQEITDEARRKIGAAHKGKKRSAEWCANIGKSHKGKTISDEQKAALSQMYTGRKRAVVDGRLQWIKKEN